MRRSNFFDNQLLVADDLNFVESSKKFSVLELTKGLTKTPGVVINSLDDSGLKVSASGITFSVNPGRAFDVNGNEIIVPSEVTITDFGKGVPEDADYRPSGILDPRSNIFIADATNHTFKVSISYKEVMDPSPESGTTDFQGTLNHTRIYNGYTITQTHSGSIPTNDLLLAEITITSGLVSVVTDRRSIFTLPHAVPKKEIGNTITVAKSGADFTSVRDAINSVTSASITNPYIILIYPGIYTESTTMSLKSYVNIVGFGPSFTIIKVQDGGSVFTTSAGIVKSITMRNIRAESTKVESPTLVFTGNATGTSIRLVNCEFSSTPTTTNFTNLTSPVMHVSSDANVIVDRCLFTNNPGTAITITNGTNGRVVFLRSSIIGAPGTITLGGNFIGQLPPLSWLVDFPDSFWKFNARNCYFEAPAGGASFVLRRGGGGGLRQYQFSLTDCTVKGLIFNYAGFSGGTIGDLIQILRCTFPRSEVMGEYGNISYPRVVGCVYQKPFPLDNLGNPINVDSGAIDLGTNFLHSDLNLLQSFDII